VLRTRTWAWASGICLEGMREDGVPVMLLEIGAAVLGCAGSGASGCLDWVEFY
jgi:hypothetical protein